MNPFYLLYVSAAGANPAEPAALARWGHEDGYGVLLAGDLGAARQLLVQNPVGAIVLDLRASEEDPGTAIAALHRLPGAATLPVLLLAELAPSRLEALLAAPHGPFDVMPVPVVAPALRARLMLLATLIHQQQQASHSDARQHHAKDEFLAMLGHELRNPLSAISSAAALIGLPGATPDATSRARHIIERQSRHLAHIIDDLLDLSRAMSGKIQLARKPLDLAAQVAASLETYRATGRSASYQLVQELAPAWIEGDPTRLEQITSNLIDNALKYTPPGGRIEVRTWSDNEDVVLSVRDTGIGIDPALLPHVFDVFVQGSAALDRAAGGLGIGLALVRRLAELHGGKVQASSTGAGGGSMFTLRLPRIEPIAAATGQLALAPAAGKARLLLIEDNDDGREMMAAMLASAGYAVQQAADGSHGLAMARACLPDVALIDIGLPGLDGYEVARRLRADPATGQIRLIALTGYGRDEDWRRVLEAGFERHLVKPVDMQHLMQVLDSAPLRRPAGVRS